MTETANGPVDYRVEDGVAVLTLSNPPVNALGHDVRKGIVAAVERARADDTVSAVVLTGAGRCFSGGADIREFGRGQNEPLLPAVIAAVESCPKPIVAAIHGTAYGGGFELPLGCHYRIAGPSAMLALPEVKLGVIPGAGGTQRLPRLIGIEAALEFILSGEPMNAGKARALGAVDEIAEGDLVAAAVSFARARADAGGPHPKIRDTAPVQPPEGFFDQARKRIARRARGLIAPGHCIKSVENTLSLDFDAGLKAERALFLECKDSPQSAAQRHLFFAERAAAKIPDVPKETPTLPIERAAVIGCGTMGAGIAMSLVNAGLPVVVLETSTDALEKGLAAIEGLYAAAVDRGRISAADKDVRLGLIAGTTDVADIGDADIVIEAVFEDMDLKKATFRALDKACKPAAILATNTSTLDVDEIAAATGRPDKVMGTHFFSPANVMRLMENVRGAETSAETVATVMKLSRAIGKVGVLVGICNGFVGNRMYHAYTRQASFLLEEGASPEQVDRAIYDFGFAMGPFAVGDVSGLDVSWRIRQRHADTRPADERYSPIADRLCEMGRFGQKTGAGWYRYDPGDRTPHPDPVVEKVILGVSDELGIERRAIGDDEIVRRCLYPLINEGAKILDEGVALRPGDIDVVWIYGYGFPMHRGGPMFHADTIGAGVILDTLERLAKDDDRLAPSPLLARLARDGKGFADL